MNRPDTTGRRRTLTASLRGFSKPVWLLFVGTFLNRFGTFVIPFLALYMTRIGFSVGEAGLALMFYGAGNFAASGCGGYLADRVGRRQTIALSMFSGSAAMLLLAHAETLPAFFLCSALAGFTMELYRPASSALLADLVPPADRIAAYAVYRLAINLGWAFGPATAGFLAVFSFTWLFIVDAATSALFGVIAWFSFPQGVRAAAGEASWAPALREARRRPDFLVLLGTALAIGIIFFQMNATYGLHVKGLGYSEAMFGLLISLNGVLIVLFELPLTALCQRWDPLRVIAVGYLLTGLGFALNAWVSSLFGLGLAMAIFTVGEMVSMPFFFAYAANRAPERMRGRFMGMMGLTWSTALTVGPLLGTFLLALDPSALWIVCGLLGAGSAAAVLGIRPAGAAADGTEPDGGAGADDHADAGPAEEAPGEVGSAAGPPVAPDLRRDGSKAV